MKRCWFKGRVAALAACAIPVVCHAGWRHAGEPGVGGGSIATASGGSSYRASQRIWRATSIPSNVASHFPDVPMTIVGVYGATTLTLLSSGPLVLVSWPRGCCGESHRWRLGHAPATKGRDGRHVYFLWTTL